MKVYVVVSYYPDYTTSVDGVFSTKESAREFAKDFKPDTYIHMLELDNPYAGDDDES